MTQCNQEKLVTISKISSLFGRDYLSAVDMRKAINGVRRTEIWPLDRNVFSGAYFFSAATTDMVYGTSHTASCEKPKDQRSFTGN